MKSVIKMVLLLGSAICYAETIDTSDSKIKRLLVGSNCYIDNPDAAERMFQGARRRCGGDTNRFARLILEVAQTNNELIAEDMIRCLGSYGTPAQLPFLYSMATNVQHGATAVESILRLEGVTSNSISLAGAYLSMTNAAFDLRADVCKALLLSTASTNVADSVRCSAREVAHRYALRTNRSVVYIDYIFTNCDSTYRFSKRRLAVMRSVLALGVHPSSTNYVTNAISELVAYPEADLPE